jgi:hypothetical protein
MSDRPDDTHAVKRVVLPSGKTIEIVYFADAADAVPATAPAPQVGSPARDLHICPSCGSGLVYPLAWEEAGEACWELQLRCPNCEWYGEGTYEQAIVERLDEELDHGTHVLVRDLKHLMHSNMEEEVGRFIEALRVDAILPMDF